MGINIEFMLPDFTRLRFTYDLLRLRERHTASHLRDELQAKLRNLRQRSKNKPPLIVLMTDNASNVRNSVLENEEELATIVALTPCDLDEDGKDPNESLEANERLLQSSDPCENLLDLLSTQQPLEERQEKLSYEALNLFVPGTSAKWFGDTIHTLQLCYKPPLKTSKTALNLISIAQGFQRQLKNSTIWMEQLRKAELPSPILDIEVRWTSLRAMLKRFQFLYNPVIALDQNGELPRLNNFEYSLMKALIQILDVIVDSVHALEVADAHCGIVPLLLRNLTATLSKDAKFSGRFKVLNFFCFVVS